MPGQAAVLTAVANHSVTGSGQLIEIFDTSIGRLIGTCSSGSRCAVAYAANAGKHAFAAYVTPRTSKVPSGQSVPSSDVVTASWIGMTLAADRASVGPGRPLTVTATSTVAIDKTGWLVQLYDSVAHTRVTYCASGNTCSTTITQTSAGGHGLVAVLAPPSVTAPPAEQVVAQTDVFPVTWLSVAVRATTNSSQPGGVIHVEAAVNAELKNSGWSLGIFDNQGDLVAPMCNTGSLCSTDVTITGAMPSFTAAVGTMVSPTQGNVGQLLAKPDSIRLTNVQATSPMVTPTVHTSRVLWGVDSCSAFTDGSYPAVVTQLGSPDFWGRYLTNTVCPGISADEISSARYYHMGILPIYNDYNCSNVAGYDTGRQYAAAAVAAARGIGIPSGVALTIDIEPPGAACPGAANVDGGFIQGWYDGVIAANYVPAYYGNGGPGTEFANAYCAAVGARPEIAGNSHIWTFQASLSGAYSKTNWPSWSMAYNTHCPEHGTAWQFMLSAGSDPNVDQDLLISDFPLWYP
ncbi:MAG TPA: glycoside hydrolase domain-containing protein [Candidatus Dormibacteraeota bacterium]|nr:glycoside hydrolase domain-containing protein [Candidatus Dormibacteraeota bacterium]